MQKTFIEFREFTEWVAAHLSDDRYADLQRELLADPNRGDVMPGCGGLRKLRVADPRRGKGKRGGARVIYLHVAEVDTIYLLDVYSKEEKAGLTARERRVLRGLAEAMKNEAIRESKRAARKNGETR